MEITRKNVGDQLILAIAKQLDADRKLCQETPTWQRLVVDDDLRDHTANGYVRWQPTAWFELSKTQQNYVSIAIKAMA